MSSDRCRRRALRRTPPSGGLSPSTISTRRRAPWAGARSMSGWTSGVRVPTRRMRPPPRRTSGVPGRTSHTVTRRSNEGVSVSMRSISGTRPAGRSTSSTVVALIRRRGHWREPYRRELGTRPERPPALEREARLQEVGLVTGDDDRDRATDAARQRHARVLATRDAYQRGILDEEARALILAGARHRHAAGELGARRADHELPGRAAGRIVGEGDLVLLANTGRLVGARLVRAPHVDHFGLDGPCLRHDDARGATRVDHVGCFIPVTIEQAHVGEVGPARGEHRGWQGQAREAGIADEDIGLLGEQADQRAGIPGGGRRRREQQDGEQALHGARSGAGSRRSTKRWYASETRISDTARPSSEATR